MSILIDCGANRGAYLKKMELSSFSKVYAFEANPLLCSRLHLKFPNVNVIENAVWINNEKLQFFLSEAGSMGSTLLKGKITKNVNYDKPIIVQCIDFAQWIIENNLQNIHLKMDIEGAEFAVLRRILDLGLKDRFQFITCEFHEKKFIGHEFIGMSSRLRNAFDGRICSHK